MWVSFTKLNFPLIIHIKHPHHQSSNFQIRCCDSKPSTPRGFGPSDDNNVKKRPSSKEQKGMALQQSKSGRGQPTSVPGQAPGVSSRFDKYNQSSADLQFEERLQSVKRLALEKKKAEEGKEFGAIDYDAPVEPKKDSIGLGTKIGVGFAVVVFGLVFAFGEFLPSGSITSNEDDGEVSKSLSKEETAALQGAAVTLVELGEYARAATLLENLAKEKPSDPDVFRLLGEVNYELKDYEASAAAYKSAAKVSRTVNFEVLRGLTNALLASKKPDEAVQVLLESRERLNKEKISDSSMKTQSSAEGNEGEDVDPVQIELLLGKAYSDWGLISDAVSVYDQLISSHPNDFRGYLAKAILLQQNGNVGDAERMFIQARFFAPQKAKALVDRHSRS